MLPKIWRQIGKRRNILLRQTQKARKLDNIVGFPSEFKHGAQVSQEKCTMHRPNGDDHVSNLHNNFYEDVAVAIWNVTKKY